MAFSYGFFNSHDGDRTYSAKQFGSIFDGIINDGVFYYYGDVSETQKADASYLDTNFHFKTTAFDGMKVRVGPGRGWFNHTWVLNTVPYTVTVPQSEVLLNRVDALVIEIDGRDDYRRSQLTVVKGPAENREPTWPPATNVKDMFDFWDTEEQKQVPIAYIRVLGKATQLNTIDIFSVVGKSVYGGPEYVTGPLKTVDISDIYSHIQNEWDLYLEHNGIAWTNWFSHIQYELDEDVAGHLQRQIDEIKKFATIYYVDHVLYVPMSAASISGKTLTFAT